MGAQTYGLGLVAKGQNAVVGGGARVWGSPASNAWTIAIADAERTLGQFPRPAVALVVHASVTPTTAGSAGALGKFKVDGFASGPAHDEIESEIELGLPGVVQSTRLAPRRQRDRRQGAGGRRRDGYRGALAVRV